MQRPDIVWAEGPDGKTGYWNVGLSVKVMIETKTELADSHMYSSMSINYDEKNTWAKVDTTSSCTHVEAKMTDKPIVVE